MQTVALAVGVILVAAAVRGYSGFGFALVGVAGLSLAVAPAIAIPTVLILEVLVGLLLLPPVWRQIDWSPVWTLLAGSVLLTPIGALFLIRAPADVARIGIAIAVAAATLLLLRMTPRPAPSRPATVGVGAVAGLLNGAFGTSGPPIALYFLGSGRDAASARASMMACFLVLDLIAVASFGIGGLVDRDVLVTVVACLPALAVGSWIGHRAFHASDAARFRPRMLLLLAALAVVTGLRGALQLLGV